MITTPTHRKTREGNGELRKLAQVRTSPVLQDLVWFQPEVPDHPPEQLGSLSPGDLPGPMAEQASISQTEHARFQPAAQLLG